MALSTAELVCAHVDHAGVVHFAMALASRMSAVAFAYGDAGAAQRWTGCYRELASSSSAAA
jgi:hypothetical protein